MATGFLDEFLIRRSLRMWAALAERAHEVDDGRLEWLGRQARRMKTHAARVAEMADRRRAVVPHLERPLDLPPSTDWSHRPAPWSVALDPKGHAPARRETAISDDVALYHDCDRGEICVRQLHGQTVDGAGPFGLQLDVFRFSGSFLSLVVRAPAEAAAGLSRDHVLRLAMLIESERPLDVHARLNLRNGPNTEQVNRAVDRAHVATVTEFDMAYVPFNEKWADHIWFDLFFDGPAMNQVIIRDLTLSRRLRADM